MDYISGHQDGGAGLSVMVPPQMSSIADVLALAMLPRYAPHSLRQLELRGMHLWQHYRVQWHARDDPDISERTVQI
jgi:hypothetical protein